MPATEAGLARLADFCGEEPAALAAGLEARLVRVQALTEAFFSQDQPEVAAPAPEAVFRDPGRARRIMGDWTRLPALRSERARDIFRRLEPRLLTRLKGAADPDEALCALDAFLERLPAGVQLFSLFEANPSLMDLLVDVCGASSELARYLGRNAGVFDAVLSRDFFKPLRGADELRPELGGVLEAAADYETKLNRARVWMKERRFRIGVHLLRGLRAPTRRPRPTPPRPRPCSARFCPWSWPSSPPVTAPPQAPGRRWWRWASSARAR
jgi:glutamate-ammonia-ligase adenylyltransferase